MKNLFFLLLIFLPVCAFAQTDWERIDLNGASEVYIRTALSGVVVTSGTEAEVAVNHIFTLDGEDRPDLRDLSVEVVDGVLRIEELSPTVEAVKDVNWGRKRKSGDVHYQNGKQHINGMVVESVLEVVVPQGVPVRVETEYGRIEVDNVEGLLSARAKYGEVTVVYDATRPRKEVELYSNYGAVDVTLPRGEGADVELTTEFGELYTDTDIDVQLGESKEKQFYHKTVGRVAGGGNRLVCHAPYGDVYLRTSK